MDWDQVVLRSLDDLRNYDVTMVCIIDEFEYHVLQLFENEPVHEISNNVAF